MSHRTKLYFKGQSNRMVTLSAWSNQHGWLSFERFETSIFSGMTHCEEEFSESCPQIRRIYESEWVIQNRFTQFFWVFSIFTTVCSLEEILTESEVQTGVIKMFIERLTNWLIPKFIPRKSKNIELREL